MSTEGGILYGQWEQIKPIAFSTDSWGVISNAVKSGTYPYKVGDTKTITLDGFGDHTVRIANVSECTNGETSQTACGFVVEFADIITTHNMNSTDTNVGGWRDCAMRSYVNSTIYNALPNDLQNVIINTTVVSSHGSSESSDFTTTDKLYLLSSKEVWNNTNTTYDSAVGATKQLDYYKNLGVTFSSYSGAIKKYDGTATRYWFRSPVSTGSGEFWTVGADGGNNSHGGSDTPTINYGVSPAFRIG